MTKQETFDIVARHLLTQNAKAGYADPDEPSRFRCAYRGEGGLKCAIGVLIPDEKYDPDFDAGCWSACSDRVGSVLFSLGHDPEFCASLQNIHDNRAPEEWAQELKDRGCRYGVSPAVVDEVLREREAKTAGDPA